MATHKRKNIKTVSADGGSPDRVQKSHEQITYLCWKCRRELSECAEIRTDINIGAIQQAIDDGLSRACIVDLGKMSANNGRARYLG